MKREMTGHSKPGPKEGQAYGIASVSNALGGCDFPMTKHDLINKYGDKQIEWTKGNLEPLKDVLKGANEQEFDSMADVVSAVSREHRKHI
jgi:hypothetical protein